MPGAVCMEGIAAVAGAVTGPRAGAIMGGAIMGSGVGPSCGATDDDTTGPGAGALTGGIIMGEGLGVSAGGIMTAAGARPGGSMAGAGSVAVGVTGPASDTSASVGEFSALDMSAEDALLRQAGIRAACNDDHSRPASAVLPLRAHFSSLEEGNKCQTWCSEWSCHLPEYLPLRWRRWVGPTPTPVDC